MSGRALEPELHDGEFAFVCVPHDAEVGALDVVASVREDEGLTLVVPAAQARARGLEVLFCCAWITLRLPSSLEATGLTARFAAALARDGIACNVFAGARHDHVFVPVARAEHAVAALRGLRWHGGEPQRGADS